MQRPELFFFCFALLTFALTVRKLEMFCLIWVHDVHCCLNDIAH